MVYVYLHINELGVFYVGCGSKKRAKAFGSRQPQWKRVADSGYSVLIVGEFSQQDAWEHEKELIAHFKPPCNKAIGGPGGPGYVRTRETREKMSGEKQINHKLTKEQVLAIREDPRPQRTIAVDYGVSKSRVFRIKSRKSWGHLEES